MSEKVAIYTGTFDPFTNGHYEVVQKALNVFDKIHIVIAVPPAKKPFLSAQERKDSLNEIFSKENRVIIETHSSLVADYCKSNGIEYIVRGLRPTGDFENEYQMACMNKKLNSKLETVFFLSSENNSCLSSSLIREISQHGGDVSGFVPQEIFNLLKTKRS